MIELYCVFYPKCIDDEYETEIMRTIQEYLMATKVLLDNYIRKIKMVF